MNLLVKGVYQFNTDLQAYGEASWSNNKVETTGTPTAPRSQYVGGDLKPVDTTLFALPVGHPDNPYNAQNLAARLYLTDFAVNSVGRGGDYDSDTYRFVAGLKGTNWEWDWDVGGMYAKTDQDISRYGFYNRTNLEQAIRGQGGFGYYRVGGSSDLNNPGIWGFVSPTLNNSTSTSVTQFDGKMTRQWLNTPGGPLGVAVGAEWRREEIDSPPVPGTDTGNVIGLGYSAANGSRDVWAFYGEANWTLLKTLELDVALRYDDYSDYGSTVEPEGRPALEPDQGSAAPRHLGDRLPRAERVRERQFGDDRVHDLHRPGALPDHRCRPRLRQRPARRGDLRQPADHRRDLRELHPRRRLGADSWHVDRHSTTGTSRSTSRSPRRCRRRSSTIRAASRRPDQSQHRTTSCRAYRTRARSCRCSRRTPTRTRPRPTASTSTPGPSGPTADLGRFTLGINWTHIFSFKRTLGDGTTSEFAGSHGPTELSSSAGTPKDRGVLGFGWDRGPWSATTWLRYTGPMQDIEFIGDENGCLHIDYQVGCHISSFTTVDVSGSYKGFKNWEIYGSINNLFNRKAPFDYQAGYGLPFYNTNYAFSGAVGTFFTLGVRYSFK